jgi:glycerol transport system ATP-binding protein
MARIHLRQLAHAYRQPASGPDDYALKPMDFVWDDGGAYALLGPSGCGKSTLLNVISGLITPSEGAVYFDDRDVTPLDPAARNIAQVFQFPVVYDTMTVFDNLAFPLRNRRLPTARVNAKVREVAAMLELEPMLHRRAHRLTADQKQKISLGRGLVRDDTAAILFDEPLTVIDPALKWHLRRQLKQVHERYRRTLIYVTHDQNEALTFAQQVIVMLDGKVLQLGTPQELFERPMHRFVGYFIGSPGMNFLPLQAQGDYLVISGTTQHVAPASIAPAGGNLQLGVRPEFIELDAKRTAMSLEAAVEHVADLGNFKLVRLRVGPHALMAKVDEGRPVPNGAVYLRFLRDRALVYRDDALVAAAPELVN